MVIKTDPMTHDKAVGSDGTHTADVESFTSPIDMAAARERKQYEDDFDYIEKQAEKARKKRQRQRSNVSEKTWEAWERVTMTNEDCNVWLGPMLDKKQPTLRSQFWQVARRAAQEQLSLSLPKTPPYMQEEEQQEEIASASNEAVHKKQRTDDTSIQKASDTYTIDTAGERPFQKASDTSTVDTTGERHTDLYYPLTFQRLTLPEWLVQQFQPDTTDPGLPPARIIRKDPLPRWACVSRVVPKLGNKISGPVCPPYGIQLIEQYKADLK